MVSATTRRKCRAMFSISKDFSFAASHQLSGLPDGHKCGRLHGHGYVVRVTLTSDDLDSCGFVLDYGALAPFGDWISGHLDHRHLNEVLPVQPSAELMAQFLHGVLSKEVVIPPGVRVAVGVSETPKTWATYDG